MCGELYKKISPGFIETPVVQDEVWDEAYIFELKKHLIPVSYYSTMK
jgi:hypothetical protein